MFLIFEMSCAIFKVHLEKRVMLQGDSDITNMTHLGRFKLDKKVKQLSLNI